MKHKVDELSSEWSPAGFEKREPQLAAVANLHPGWVVRGKGAYVWSSEGRKYIDCGMGWGSVLLGHANPKVSKAISRQAKLGTTFTGATPQAAKVARLVKGMVPYAEKLRFGKNGSDVTLAAVRVARAFTERETVVHCGYHGFHDWSVANSFNSDGVPKALRDGAIGVRFNSVDSLTWAVEPRAHEVAAIIIDPVADGMPTREFLAAARQLADRFGIVLIFDEIMSGFRIARGGAYEVYGIQPDLVCLGKSTANGMAVSMVGGNAQLMSPFARIWYGLTFEQEAVSLAAAAACLEVIRDENVPLHLNKIGQILKDEYRLIATKLGLDSELISPNQRLIPKFSYSREFGSDEAQSVRFTAGMYEQGIIVLNAIYLSFAHDESVAEQIVTAFKKALTAVAQAKAPDPYAGMAPKTGLRADLTVEAPTTRISSSEQLTITVRVTNTGTAPWLPSTAAHGAVNLGAHLVDDQGKFLIFDHWRLPLPSPQPGGADPDAQADRTWRGAVFTLHASVPVPNAPGNYGLELDLVSEGVTWFKDCGSKTATVQFSVI